MLNLRNWLLNEALSSFNYVIPTDKRQQMADFYALSMLKGRSSFDLARIKHVTEKGIDSYQFGKPFNVDNDMSHEDYVDYALEEIANKLIPYLKENILQEVLYSICAEIRHVGDKTEIPRILEVIKEKLGEKSLKIFKKYFRDYKLRSNHFSDLARNIDSDLEKNYKSIDYKNSYNAFLNSKADPESFVKICKFLFNDEDIFWNDSYGGPAWQQICEAWEALNNAKTLKNQFVQIDHIYDIQHNGGSVFNKLTSYSRPNSDYKWIGEFLDKKAKINNPLELYKDVSQSMKKILAKAAKFKFGTSLEDSKRKYEVLKDDNVISELAKKTKARIKQGSPFWRQPLRIKHMVAFCISSVDWGVLLSKISLLFSESKDYEEAIEYFIENMLSLTDSDLKNPDIRISSILSNEINSLAYTKTLLKNYPKKIEVNWTFYEDEFVENYILDNLNEKFLQELSNDGFTAINTLKKAIPVLGYGEFLGFAWYVYNKIHVNNQPLIIKYFESAKNIKYFNDPMTAYAWALYAFNDLAEEEDVMPKLYKFLKMQGPLSALITHIRNIQLKISSFFGNNDKKAFIEMLNQRFFLEAQKTLEIDPTHFNDVISGKIRNITFAMIGPARTSYIAEEIKQILLNQQGNSNKT